MHTNFFITFIYCVPPTCFDVTFTIIIIIIIIIIINNINRKKLCAFDLKTRDATQLLCMVIPICVVNYKRYNFAFTEFTVFVYKCFNIHHISATLNDFNLCTDIVTLVNVQGEHKIFP